MLLVYVMRVRQVINLLQSATSNKTDNNNYYYQYYNSYKITIMRWRIDVFFGEFRQFSAYFGHPVYFGLSSNQVIQPVFFLLF